MRWYGVGFICICFFAETAKQRIDKVYWKFIFNLGSNRQTYESYLTILYCPKNCQTKCNAMEHNGTATVTMLFEMLKRQIKQKPAKICVWKVQSLVMNKWGQGNC